MPTSQDVRVITRMTKFDNLQFCFLLLLSSYLTATLSDPSRNETVLSASRSLSSSVSRETRSDSRNVTADLGPLHRAVRSPRKARNQRSNSPKRKVKRLRIESIPFLKLFSIRKLISKRFVRRNARSGSSKSRFNRPRFKVR